ncbi:hypothetical protein CXG81DRAFT_18285 [Caulochytrium protostelioides]|uniref:Methyltransferase type 11 domain-containing protein n=1 Tax=Caulochytrium protostelioides TaxID=1555241 RepID=A0A4P9X9L7_9FUNG|nr:hypothetical protein CXG81DRAFT_18285 [Caulochytrium protostelioides]|eukprot:RKP01992.1 hypothetical protein CXG81DRAFT_18285 [Caulochytrium protostelioides]
MATPNTRFGDSDYNSSNYRDFRPDYGQALYDRIYAFHDTQPQGQGYDVAVDVGTGTGQVATALAKRFAAVKGFDSSEAMLQSAEPGHNITYRAAPAEKLPAEDHSVDLVTVGTALHWFDTDRFMEEVKRILKPGGTLACFGYHPPQCPEDPTVTEAVRHLYHDVLGTYWDPRAEHIMSQYRDVAFPFTTVERHTSPPEPFCITKRHTSESLRALCRTWSGYKTWKERHPRALDCVDNMQLPPDDVPLDLVWPSHLVLCKP